MGLIEFILDVLSHPAVWLGVGFGILAASFAWYFLPELADPTSIGGWAIAIGFVGGLIVDYPFKDKND